MPSSYRDSFDSFGDAGVLDRDVAAALPLAERLARRLHVRTMVALAIGLVAGILIGMAVLIASPSLHTRIATSVFPPVPAAPDR